ncbi:MAG TPA: hypothetical protein VGN95_23790 [Pyrinomonadaceae bacterium]|nr:hypothetical protein [Pyrinomonadaceae bacterium]
MNSKSSMLRLLNALPLTLALAVGLLLFMPAPTTAQRRASSSTTRIKFMPGAISAQVRGQLTKDKNTGAVFVINAKAGEHMIVNIIPLTRGLMTGGDVTSPSGQQDGQHGGLIFNGDLTETGDYTIHVDRNLMGTERPDGSFILEVVITQAYMKN